MVHAKVRALSEKIPLPLLSSGIEKILSILLVVQLYSHGIVLIDEMENGLYFDLMGRISSVILKAAIESNVQIFVTTHSLEYLRSLEPIIREYPDEFRLIRTTKNNGSNVIDCFDSQHFIAALEEGFEIR